MVIPSEIMIAENLVKVLQKQGGDFSKAGEWNGWFHQIVINNDEGRTEFAQAEVLMHEIFEGINDIFELGLDHKTITLLSELVFQTIRRNKLDFVNP